MPRYLNNRENKKITKQEEEKNICTFDQNIKEKKIITWSDLNESRRWRMFVCYVRGWEECQMLWIVFYFF